MKVKGKHAVFDIVILWKTIDDTWKKMESLPSNLFEILILFLRITWKTQK